MYFCNENILKYAQIAQSAPKSMFLNIEGRSKDCTIEALTFIFFYFLKYICGLKHLTKKPLLNLSHTRNVCKKIIHETG